MFFLALLGLVAAASNDLCSNATVISDGVTTGNNVGAGNETNCIPQADIFFSYVATCSGVATVTVPNSAGNFRAVSFTGTSCASLGAEKGCSGASPITLTLIVTSGQSYYFAVGSTASYRGDIPIILTCNAAPNDYCSGAIDISDGLTQSNNFNATLTSQTSGINYYDVFFRYTATCTGRATYTFVGADFEGAYYSGNSCAALGTSTSIDDPQTQSFYVNSGIAYYIAVGSYYSSTRANINITFVCNAAPANDICTGATIISDGLTVSSNANVNPVSQTSGINYGDVFFRYTATCTGSAFMTFIGGYWEFTYFASSDCAALGSFSVVSYPQTLQFPVVLNNQYVIAVGSYYNQYGPLNLTMSCNPYPSYDSCSGAIAMGNSVVIANSTWATRQSSCVYFADIFVRYQASCTGTGVATFTGVGGGSLSAVMYTGTSCLALGSENLCQTYSVQPVLQFSTIANQYYYFAVGGSSNYQGLINISMQCFLPPANDICTSAIELTDGVTTTSTNNYATLQSSSCITYADVFFHYSATCTGVLVFNIQSTSGNYLDTALFAASSCTALGSASCGYGLTPNYQRTVTIGQSFYLAVGADGSSRGPFNVTVSCHIPPAYDTCAGALTIGDGVTTADNTYCDTSSCVNYADIYFRYQATCTGTVDATFISPMGSYLEATGFTGNTCAALGTSSCNSAYAPLVEFGATAGQYYYLAVGSSYSGIQYQGIINASLQCHTGPSNDYCAGAWSIGDGITTVNNTWASSQTCVRYADVFVLYVASCTGTADATFTTSTGNNYLQAAVFTSNSCATLGTGTCYSAYSPNIQYSVVAGQSYYMAVGSYYLSNFRGAINVTMQCHPAPANDLCSGAKSISDGTSTGNNTWALSETSCIYNADIYFRYTATCSGTAAATFTATGFDYLQAAVFSSQTCGSLGTSTCTSLYYSPYIELAVVQGQSYVLAVGSYSSYRGAINVFMECHAAPTNDVCSGAIVISDGVTQATNVWATKHTNCIYYADVYFAYLATCTGSAAATAYATGNPTLMAVGLGSSCSGTESGCTTQNPTTVNMQVVAGQISYFAVGAYSNYRGLFNVSVVCYPAPPQDTCSGAIVATTGITNTTNVGAGKSTACIRFADIYFTHVATCTGQLTVVATAGGSDLQAVAFTGSSCATLSESTCTDFYPETLYFYGVTIGQRVYFAVGSYSTFRGQILVQISCTSSAPSRPPTTRYPSYSFYYPTPSMNYGYYGSYYGELLGSSQGSTADAGLVSAGVFLFIFLVFCTLLAVYKQKQSDALAATVARQGGGGGGGGNAVPMATMPVAQPTGGPMMAQPVMAQPMMAQPMMAQPVMAQPVMAQPYTSVAPPIGAQPYTSVGPPIAQPTR